MDTLTAALIAGVGLPLIALAGYVVKVWAPTWLEVRRLEMEVHRADLQNKLNSGNAAVASRKAGEILAENNGVLPQPNELAGAVTAKAIELATIRKDSLTAAGATNLTAKASDLVLGELGKLLASSVTPAEPDGLSDRGA